MAIFEFLSLLNNLDIKIWVEDGQLRYRAPKGAMTDEIKQQIKERKAEIIAFLQEAQTATQINYSSLVPVVRDKDLPLSFAQQRMWFLSQLDGESTSYNESFQLRIVGKLSLTALEQSINEIIRRHEVLRTNFPTVEGVPFQVIRPNLTLSIPVINVQEFTEIAVQEIINQEVNKSFDLGTEPLIRATLLQQDPESHLLLITMHHIIIDGWSMGVFFKELEALYPAFIQGKPSPLPELTIQYADFALWQREWLTKEVQDKQLEYWKQQLAGTPPLLELPTDYPRPPEQSFAGASIEFNIDADLTSQLVTLSQKSGVTLFMTLLTAFAVVLHRYSGQDDICIGSPFANRNRREIDSLIGFFVNTLVLRTQMEGNPRFSQLLEKVRSVVWDAHAHQDIPFEQVVEALKPERSLGYNPLFQVMFVLENFSLDTLELPGISLTPEIVDRGTAKFDLGLSMWQTQQGLIGSWEYNSDIFAPDTIARMINHFQTLLAGIVKNPEQRIGELPLLTESEKHQLLTEWNDTQVEYPVDKCIHQLFEEQVEKTPNAIAVVFENEQLTYQQLNSRANQLAHHLQSLGVKPETLVGICVERSLEMVIGLLGILKAGGAYVPLDPEYPTERLSFMLEDAQVSVLLTQKSLLNQLPLDNREKPCQVICLEQLVLSEVEVNTFNLELTENPNHQNQPENLAYVIYTSGSTGKPKGVTIEHRAIVNLSLTWGQTFQVQNHSRLLQFGSFSFDLSVGEITTALVTGACLYLGNKVTLLPSQSLVDFLTVNKITHSFLSPSALSVLPKAKLPDLQCITVGGEACTTELVNQWGTERKFYNCYGPTESTVTATIFHCQPNGKKPAIGKAISNIRTYILDKNNQLLPPGIPGELCIAGVGLARGYLNRPQATGEKFIEIDINGQVERIYKTGDLARYLADGNIEYIGRIDNQVKIRGFRIELGEIEAVLNQHPQIQTSCVIVREDNPGQKQLVSYLIPHQHSTVTISEMRQYLKETLPEYMVPHSFVTLETLPITPNGKIDRRALPKPELESTLLEKYVAARNPIEELLTQTWLQVLKVESVGINDNFFELGGHSLIATQIVSRIRNIFQVELPLNKLFAAPTVRELAHIITQLQQDKLELSADKAPLLLPRAKDADLPMSFAQQRLWFLDQFEANSVVYNMPTALRLLGKLQIAALEQSLQTIIHRHEALRTNFTTIDGQPIQVIREQKAGNKEQGIVSIVDLQHLPKTEQEIAVEQLTQQQMMTGFDLETEALIRVQLILLNETEQVLLVCMHHIVSDGWSMGVFVQELTQLYNAYCQNQPLPLTPLPIQYSDFAIWQRQWLQGDVLQNQITYWEQQLKDAPTLLSLPTDRPRPAVQTLVGATHEFALSVELTDKLIKLSQNQGCTLFMTLLAAYDTLLYRYTGQSDILVGSPIANRDRAEIEGLIGLFVNTLVMRTNLADNPRFSELLTRVREVALGAYAHQHLPFEMLVEALQPERDLSHSPLFQVMFNLQNAPVSELELNGLTVSSVPFKGVTAAFDMTLFMQNTDNGLVGVWEYNTNLFDHSTIERMIGHFVTLLEAVVNNPQERIDKLPILTADEKQKLLIEWNNTQSDYPVGKCLHQLFAQQVELTPDAVAVVFDDQQLTYQQLNTQANQLAHYLQSLGVGAEVLVGIYLERSLSMTVALLAVLKAGGGYVPLDVDYPQQRLTYISQDSQISVLITQESLLNSLPVEGVKVLVLDQEYEVFNSQSPENPFSEVLPENLACVLYTSGSTGQPKGVILTHGALVNHSSAISEAFGLTSSDRVLQFAAFGFDVALEEIFPTWFKGGTVVLRPTQMFSSFANFAQFIEQQQLSVLTLTSAYWHEWMVAVSQSYATVPQSLRLLTVGGDTVLPETVAMWQQLVGNRITCLNAYGPTEASVTAIIYDVQNFSSEKTNTVLIGRPVANTEIYILDSNLQAVPMGVKGELYIGGERLARGYLNRPELTQEKFIAHPFNNPKSQIKNPKLYKTGDLARYLPDGNIEFIGRIDDVVKIRGFRVALGEIESLLIQHPDVICQVVILREDQPGHKQLVAYVVTDNPSLTQNELQSFLKQKLPNYMIPTAFVMMEGLPVTTNGKVDRRALPAPSQEINLSNFVLPNTPTQKLIADIWRSVLVTTQLGIHNNFFDIGGNSLRAMQVMSLLTETLQIDLPLRYLFENPTVAELAAGFDSLLTSQTNTITTSNLDLKAEAVLDPSIQIPNQPFEYNNKPQGIFLTGVTGFLGSHLLYELLQHTQADIYCLIRATNIEQAQQKLQNQLQLYKLWSGVDRKRIIPVVGDLGKNYLGLSTSEFQQLAGQIDAIYHCGAWINVIYPYSVLKPANVLGTQEIIRLASEIKVKPLHYISTTSVLSAATPNETGLILESDLLEQYQVLENGYVQSKWVAEKLVMQSRDLGLPVAIYRASRITGNTQTGISNTDDLFCRLVKGCLETRIFPDVQMEDNLTPVDYVSKIIVNLSGQKESLGKAFHLVNPESTTIRDLFHLMHSLGYPVQMIPVEKWHSEISLESQISDTDNLRVLSHIIPKVAVENSPEPQIDYENTINGVGNIDLMYPALDQKLLKTYISYFISSGFIDEQLVTEQMVFENMTN
ncbi:non-ribosomal peptide synthetase [Dolichospermum heterosporum]|uniref:Amino acid adenylation domain-containing protein n=1 Tax=Dolichospermum heterosporum TAC447 TaxID=747523 RepID=A0ABY5M241_9CYAN|nr:non-ribosomal peptide synthetase [Dolichospermum heterosporum]UUO17102.1 amino acid adenylation domain-containing protein [Dolichospermum heterosporum TAC447]